MNLGDYELIQLVQEMVDSCVLENLRTEIARLKAENEELRAKLNQLNNQENVSARQGILIYHLPEEENSFQIAVKAMDYALAWFQLVENIRQILKYQNPPKEKAEAFELMRDWMVDLENEYELVSPI